MVKPSQQMSPRKLGLPFWFRLCRLKGLQLEDRVPDAKTVWLFLERLKGLNLADVLFARFHQQLTAQGYVVRPCYMIDANFVEVPRQGNRREENAQLSAGY